MLLREILVEIFKEVQNDMFMDLEIDILHEIFEERCCKSLQEIKSIIEDNTLSDFECVEKIVCVFENIGSHVSYRHDFG